MAKHPASHLRIVPTLSRSAVVPPDEYRAGGNQKHRRNGKKQRASTEPHGERATSRAVLVVDDDAATRTEMREILEHAGYAVVEAENGNRALDYLVSGAKDPRLILLDLRMPVMSGTELLSILKRYIRLAHIPVVVVAGTDPDGDLGLRDVTVAGFLRKPYSVEALTEVVDRFALPAEEPDPETA